MRRQPRFWACPEEWPNETVFIVAGGTSVWDCDLDSLRGQRVLAVNSSVFSVPFADFLVWNDDRWWKKHEKAIREVYRGRIVTTHNGVPDGAFGMCKVGPHIGIANARTELAMLRTTTQAAMNLAVHLGANRIVLLGVDLCERVGPDSVTGKPVMRRHHHEEHPWAPKADAFSAQMQNLKATVEPLKRRGIEVINCSAISKIEWWPKRTLAEVLADVRKPDAGLAGTDGLPDRGRAEREGVEPAGPAGARPRGRRHQRRDPIPALG